MILEPAIYQVYIMHFILKDISFLLLNIPPARTLQRTIDKGPMNPGPRCFILEYFYFYILTKTGPLLKLDVKVVIPDNTFEVRDVLRNREYYHYYFKWRRAK